MRGLPVCGDSQRVEKPARSNYTPLGKKHSHLEIPALIALSFSVNVAQEPSTGEMLGASGRPTSNIGRVRSLIAPSENSATNVPYLRL